MSLLPILFAVFIDSLGFGLVIPIFSPLIVNNEGEIFADEVSIAVRGMIFGLLVSSFCVGQFFAGPVLGTLSDRRGRKKILMVTIWMALFGYLIAACGIWLKSLFLLFSARVLCGIAAGNFGVAQSVVANQYQEKERAKNFGLVGMAWWTGFIVGPYVGGKLSLLGHSAPFTVSAFFCLLSALFLKWKMQETPLSTAIEEKPINFLAGALQVKKAFQMAHLRWLFIIMFIVNLGWGFFTEFSPVFLIRYWEFDLEQIANFYAWMGLWIALCQGLLIRPFLKRISLETVLVIALFAMGALLPLMLWMEKTGGMFWLIPWIALAEALIFPSAATLVSNWSRKEVQGEVLGIHNSVQWAAIGITPMFSGSLVALYPHLPITVGSVAMFCAFFLALWFFRKRRQTAAEEL